MEISKNVISGIHIGIGLFLVYLAWAILTRTTIPEFVGVLIILIILGIVVVEIYSRYDKKDDSAHGLMFNPNDPKYKPIGGIGGVGWI